MARKTLRWSGIGGLAKVVSLIRVLVGAIACFCAFAAFGVGSLADGGADRTAALLLAIGVVGMVLTVVITAFLAVRLSG